MMIEPQTSTAPARDRLIVESLMSLRDDAGDPAIASFVRRLLPSHEAEEVLNGFYTDAFHACLIGRLAALRENPAPKGGRRICPLPKWKLRRVDAHVNDNIGERISLAELAGVAGLSEMHFAAQFKLATGQRPHDYVMHRRIQHARQMMIETNEPIVQVALAVGFQTQAHFTTAFKRVVGMTPYRWRQAALADGRDRAAAEVGHLLAAD